MPEAVVITPSEAGVKVASHSKWFSNAFASSSATPFTNSLTVVVLRHLQKFKFPNWRRTKLQLIQQNLRLSPDDLKKPLGNYASMSIHMEEVLWLTTQILRSLLSYTKCRKSYHIQQVTLASRKKWQIYEKDPPEWQQSCMATVWVWELDWGKECLQIR